MILQPKKNCDPCVYLCVYVKERAVHSLSLSVLSVEWSQYEYTHKLTRVTKKIYNERQNEEMNDEQQKLQQA